MKKIFVILSVMLVFCGCKKESESTSVEVKQYGDYPTFSSEQHLDNIAALVAEKFEFTDYTAEFVYAINGEPRFMLVELEPIGYVIYFILGDRYFPLELSKIEESKYKREGVSDKKKYYNFGLPAPGYYYEEDGKVMRFTYYVDERDLYKLKKVGPTEFDIDTNASKYTDKFFLSEFGY